MARYTIGFERLGVDLSTVNSRHLTTCFNCSEDRKQANKNKKVLYVSTETGNYYCNHCNIKGRVDSDEWIQSQHDYENKPIPKKQPSQPKQNKQVSMKPFHTHPLTTKVLEYLKGRGISKKTAEVLKISNNEGCLAFNYYENGKIVGAKYRKLDQKFFWQHAGCKKTLYNLDNLKDQKEIILVEGEFDVAAIVEAGFLNCGSVSQGAPNAGSEVGSKLLCLDNSIDAIKAVKRVIVFTDGDANGRYLEKILVERFGADRCALVKVPKELVDRSTGELCKDANAVLINYGPEVLRDLILNAEDTPISGVRTVRQVEGAMWDIYNNGYKKGVSTGMRCLDGHFSFYKPWWNLFYGIPGSGKSEFTLFLMMSMAVNHGWKWAVFSPESYPAEDFYNDCVIKLTGRRFEEGEQDRLNPEEYQAAIDFVNEHFFFIYPQDDKDAKGKYLANNFKNVVSKIKELKLAKGIDGFLIDPLNQLSASVEFAGPKDEKLERMYGEIDILCKTHNLSGNIVAHTVKQTKEKDEEDFKCPTPYDIAGGAMNFNKAYCIICVHRPFNQSDKTNTSVEIDIQKIKKHRVGGTPAMVPINYNPWTTWYKSESTPRGFGAIENFFKDKFIFEDLGSQQDQSSALSFRDKMAAEEKEVILDANGNPTPLDDNGDHLPF